MAQRLSVVERARIEAMYMAGVSVSETARCLGRAPSTIYRECKRAGCSVRGYDAQLAQTAADARAARPKVPRLVADPRLGAEVTRRLALGWSPHAVSADLRVVGLSVCAETIYRAAYDHSGRSGLAPGSWRRLPRRRRYRRKRSRLANNPRPLGDYRPIADRCIEALDRSEAGHWEGDLIIGKNNGSAVATLTERLSRMTLAVALPNGHDAKHTASAVTAALRRQPPHLVKTLTWDQGREMARWQNIETALDIKIYFCDPRSPWQRPTNEQTNGLLRRWLPKGTDININPTHLSVIENNLNTMPRKLHNWKSAKTIYIQLTCNHH